MKYLLLATGGAIGTLMRYGMINLCADFFRYTIFPWSTLTVNLIGSFVIGILAGMNEHNLINPSLNTFLFIGLLGGFTTFSAFSIESLQLFRQSQFGLATVYITVSCVVGILLSGIGFILSRWLFSLLK